MMQSIPKLKGVVCVFDLMLKVNQLSVLSCLFFKIFTTYYFFFFKKFLIEKIKIFYFFYSEKIIFHQKKKNPIII